MHASAADSIPAAEPSPVTGAPLIDRRQRSGAAPQGSERRQFASSYNELSHEARELALAIDSYKVEHRRRYLTFEEMLQVIRLLGYHKE